MYFLHDLYRVIFIKSKQPVIKSKLATIRRIHETISIRRCMKFAYILIQVYQETGFVNIIQFLKIQ